MNDEMQIIQVDRKFGIIMAKEIIGIDPKCSFCGCEVNETNFGGIFSKPTQLSCDNITCLINRV